MSRLCLSNLTTNSIAQEINAAAFDLYIQHDGIKPFTYEQKIDLYASLIKAIANRDRSGDMTDRLSGIENGAEIDLQNLLIYALGDAMRAIQTVHKADPGKKSNKVANYGFTGESNDAINLSAAIARYKIRYPAKTVSTLVSDPLVEVSKAKTGKKELDDILTPDTMIQKLFKPEEQKLKDPVIAYFNHVVNSTWVDSKVVDGKVRGYTSLKDIVVTAKHRLQKTIYDWFFTRSMGAFSTIKDGVETKYIVFPSSVSDPVGFDENAKPIGEAGVRVGQHATFKTMTTTAGKEVEVNLVIADTMENAMATVATLGKGAVYVESKSTPAVLAEPLLDYTKHTYTNSKELRNNDMPAFYAHILTDGNNYAAFLKYQYEVLDEAYKSSFRSGIAQDGTVVGDAQDSVALKLHKQATPRLKQLPSGELVVDSERPYLTPDDFNLVAAELSTLGEDLPTIREGLRKLSESTGISANKKSIVDSIYNRFFNLQDYEITYAKHPTNGEKVTELHRSYAGILASQRLEPLPLETYEKFKSSGKAPKMPNALLDKSLSAIVTSFRSIVFNEQARENNGRLVVTNLANEGASVAGFNDSFIAATTERGSVGAYTKASLFSKGKITVLKADAPSGETRFIIAIKHKDNNVLSYTVKVNLSDKGEFANGIPVTIIDRSSATIPAEDVAGLFFSLGIPSSVTSTKSLGVVLDALKSSKTLPDTHRDKETILENGSRVNLALDNLYMNMLFTMLLNGHDTETTRQVNALSASWPAASGTEVRYNPIDAFYGYKDSLVDIMQKTETDSNRKHIVGWNGNRQATHTLNSYSKKLQSIADSSSPEGINGANVLVTGKYKMGKETFAKTEIKNGDNVKSTENMTENENARFLIDTAFLGKAMSTKDHNTVLIQPGAFADRKNPPLIPFSGKSKNSDIFLKEVNTSTNPSGWNSESWLSDGVALQTLGKFGDEARHKVTNHKTLGELLTSIKVTYNELKAAAPNLLTYANIREDANGIAYLKAKDSRNLAGLNVTALAREAMMVHQNYYKGIDRVATKRWNKAIKAITGVDPLLANLQQVSDYLKKNSIKFKAARASSDLTLMSMIEAVDKSEDPDAKVPEDILQSIALFSNDTLALEYMETMRRMFHKQLANIGYEQVLPSVAKNVATVMREKDLSIKVATDVLFDAYFYNSQILGNSALNLLSGGTSQYDVKGKSMPLFRVVDTFTKGRLNTTAVLSIANNLKVPGSNSTLGTISVEELLLLRSKAIADSPTGDLAFKLDRLSYIKLLLTNEKTFGNADNLAKALIFNDATRHLNDKFVTQLKRNQVYGSAMQLMRLAGNNEPGAMLTQTSKTVTVVDDKLRTGVLGKSGDNDIVVTDGVEEFFPLYEYFYNNSVGGNESSFRYDGTAIKALTISMDADGIPQIHKKAEYGTMSDDLVVKGSVVADQRLRNLGTAVTFHSKIMMVDGPANPSQWTKITEADWKTHGLSFRTLQYNDGVNPAIVLSTSAILHDIKTNPTAKTKFVADLAAGRYLTDKIPTRFNNVYEIWEHFGAHKNPIGWALVAELIGNHAGNATNNIDLTDAVYPNRDAWIAKVSYMSEVKTGSRRVISTKDLFDPNFSFTDGINHKWAEVSNKHHGTLLQKEHEYDTTRSFDTSRSSNNEDSDDSVVSVITQLISAVGAEGQSIKEATAINTTMATMNRVAVDGMLRGIVNSAVKKDSSLEGQQADLLAYLKSGPINKHDPHVKALYDACVEFGRTIMKATLRSRQGGAGLASDLLSNEFRDSLTFDQKQLLPLFQSQLFAAFDRNAVKIKFPGGQYVVSPSHRYLPSYELKDAYGNIIRSGLFREDMNRMFYGDIFNSLPTNSIVKQAIEFSYPLQKIIDPNMVKLSDKVIDAQGKVHEFVDIRNKFRVEYNALNLPESPTTPSFEAYLTTRLQEPENTYMFRFGNVQESDEKRLEYAKWYRHKLDGTVENIYDTDEYKAYNAIAKVKTAFASGDAYHKYFGLTVDSSGRKIEGDNAEAQIVKLRSDIPKNLVKEYFFATPKESGFGEAVSTIQLTPSQEAAFETWYAKPKKPLALASKIYTFIGQQSTSISNYEDRFKIPLYNLLQDKSKGWVSTPSEVYMPHMHASAFFINENDSLYDFIKMKDFPSANKLESLGILTHDEVTKLSFDYQKTINSEAFVTKLNRLSDIASGIVLTSPDEVKRAKWYLDEIGQYQDEVKLARANMTREFRTRVEKLYGTKSVKGNRDIGAAANLFVFTGRDTQEIILEATKKLDKYSFGSSSYQVLTKIISRLKTKAVTESVSNIIAEERDSFITNKVTKLVANFHKTLEFVMARIPGQGKQSAVVGKIKNLITSSKNSIYGPAELVLIAGLDFDIDTQNIMTWSLDADGEIVPWTDYLDGDKLTAEKMYAFIKEDAKKIKEEFMERKAYITNTLNKLDPSTLTTDVQKEEMKVKISRLENYLHDIDENLVETLEASDASNRERFMKAGKNYIVHNLRESLLDPANAIEATTPISNETPAEAISLPEVANLFGKSITLEDVLITQGVTSGMNSFSTIQYENITLAGRSGIGITASDLKGYLAVSYATNVAEEHEQKYVRLKSDLKEVDPIYYEKFGIDPTALQFFKLVKDADGNSKLESRTMRLVANTEKWSKEGEEIRTKAAEVKIELKKLIDSGNSTPEAEAAIVGQYINAIINSNKFNTEPQAWEQLSQLLTAATDNAKELILGRIGANSITSSVIATMVRLGVPLKDALAVIQSKAISDIVKAVQKSTDIKVLAQENLENSTNGQLPEEKYSLQLLAELEKAFKPLPSGPVSDERMIEYLTDPIRILLEYTRTANEFQIVRKNLSLNQGLKNSADETFLFIDGINRSINKILADANKGEDAEPFEQFDLKQFVSDVINGETVKVNKTLDILNDARRQVHPLFVLLKNEHFFSYLETLIQAKSIRDRASFIYTEVENALTSANSTRSHTKPGYRNVTETMYEFGVLKYLEDNYKTLNIGDTTYNLSLPEAVGNIKGRSEFLADIPPMVLAIRDNAFVSYLRMETVMKDNITGASVPILKGKNTEQLDTLEKAAIKEGLSQLDPQLSEALFVYGMIVSKGGYSAGSYIGLIAPEIYVKFEKYLLDNAQTIRQGIIASADVVKILNPFLLKQVNTVAKTTASSKEQEVPDELLDMQEFEPEQDEMDINAASSFRIPMNLKILKYDTSALNARYKTKSLQEEFVRSRNNGMVYQLMKSLGIYVPLTRNTPTASLPQLFPTKDNISKTLLQRAGFVQGFTVNLPESVLVKNSKGEHVLQSQKGQVLTFIDSWIRSNANPELRSILDRYPVSMDKTVKSYLVMSTDGSRFSVVTAEDLGGETNPGFIFDDHFIGTASKTFSPAKTVAKTKRTVYKRGSKYYASKSTDTTVMQQPFEVDLIRPIASEGSRVAYDEIGIKGIVAEAQKNKIADKYTKQFAEEQFDLYIDQMLNNLVAASLGKDLSSAIKIRNNPRGKNILVIDEAKSSLDRKIGYSPSLVTKLKILSQGSIGAAKLFKSIYPDKAMSAGVDVKYVPEGYIPEAAIKLLTHEAENNVTSLTIREFKDLTTLLKVEDETFETYINKFLSNNGLSMVELDDVVYIGLSEKVAAGKELSGLEAKSSKSKPIVIPPSMRYEYVKPASKAVFLELTKMLNKHFPGVKWKLLTSREIETTYGKEFANSKGFFKNNGEVIINSDSATLETPLHEFGHIYLQYLQKEDIESYDRIIALTTEHGLFNTMKKSYRMLSDRDVAEEVFCELLSMDATDKLLMTENDIVSKIREELYNDEGFFGKVKTFFSNLFTKFFGTSINLNMNDSLSSIITKLSDDILFGNKSLLSNFSEDTKNFVRKSRTTATLDLKEAREVLLSRGYIQWFCV